MINALLSIAMLLVVGLTGSLAAVGVFALTVIVFGAPSLLYHWLRRD